MSKNKYKCMTTINRDSSKNIKNSNSNPTKINESPYSKSETYWCDISGIDI